MDFHDLPTKQCLCAVLDSSRNLMWSACTYALVFIPHCRSYTRTVEIGEVQVGLLQLVIDQVYI